MQAQVQRESLGLPAAHPIPGVDGSERVGCVRFRLSQRIAKAGFGQLVALGRTPAPLDALDQFFAASSRRARRAASPS
jgi:hypothetical protein